MKSRKGFTLVELLVVIAILAILATASIIGFTAFTKKAQVSNDSELVTQLNKYAQAASVSKDFKTVTEMRDELIESGFELANLKLEAEKQGYVIGFDVAKDRFVLLKDGAIAEGYTADKNQDVFAFVKTQAEVTTYGNAKFSLYLQNGFAETSLTVETGVDVGENTGITAISYDRSTVTNPADHQEVVIRTNSANTNLTIIAASDTVNHFGSVGSVDAQKIDMNCYNEYGKAAYVKVTEGKVVAKAGGTISVVFAANNDAEKVAVIKESQGTITTGLTVIQPVSDTNVARENGIALEYSIDGATAAAPEFNFAAALETRETAVNTVAAAAVETNLIEEIEASGLYEARIGAVGYETLESGVDAAQKGQTIVLLKDITKDGNYRTPSWSKGFNVDFNGHSFTSVYDGNPGWNTGSILFTDVQNGTSDDFSATISNAVIYSKKGTGLYVGAGQSTCGVTLTVENCTINQQFMAESGDGAYFAALRITEGGVMIVNSGNYKGYHSIEMGSNATATNNMTVNGGTFDGRVRVGKASTLTINGGTFVNFVVVSDSSADSTGISINGGTFDADPSSYVAAGHHATNNGDGTWTVSAD